MRLNPLSLLKTAAKVVGKAVGVDVAAALQLLSDDPSPESQRVLQEFEVEMRRLSFQELETEINAKVDLMKTEIKSEDAWVRRARPTGLYISYLVSLGLAGALIAGVAVDATAVLTLLGPLMGFSSFYTHQRTQEKKAGKA